MVFVQDPSTWATASTSTVSPEKREFITDPGASNRMTRKAELSPEELETIRVSRYGSIDATEEGTVYVKDLDIFVTVRLLEDSPAVLALRKLRGDNGYSYGWGKRKTPCQSSFLRSPVECTVRGDEDAEW